MTEESRHFVHRPTVVRRGWSEVDGCDAVHVRRLAESPRAWRHGHHARERGTRRWLVSGRSGPRVYKPYTPENARDEATLEDGEHLTRYVTMSYRSCD